MTQLIRRPDGMRYVDAIEGRTAAVERQIAGDITLRLDTLDATDIGHTATLADHETRIDAVEADVATKGRLIDVQRLIGSNNAYAAIATGGLFYMNAALSIPMRFSYTPPVDVWWETRMNVGVLQKTDAAYHYGYVSVGLNTPDADGHQGAYQIFTQHSTVDVFGFRVPTKTWKLTGGVAYQASAIFTASGGTWSYYQGDAYHFAEAKAWTR